ncbi:unnamed protein product [Penicillium glandicola]
MVARSEISSPPYAGCAYYDWLAWKYARDPLDVSFNFYFLVFESRVFVFSYPFNSNFSTASFAYLPRTSNTKNAMPKRKAPAQSDTSGSSGQSKQSIGSQYANQSPAKSNNSGSSGGLTKMMSTIYETFSPISDAGQIAGLDGEGMSPDLLTPPDTVSGFSLTPGSQPDVLKKKSLAGKFGLPQQLPRMLGGKASGFKKFSEAEMQDVIATTQEATARILTRTELEGSRFGYLASKWTTPKLNPDSVDNPKSSTVVKVVAGDTYDRAVEMQAAGSTSDHMPVCVLNFANAYFPGGGWLGGSRAQEEQLCYRSTLIDTLHTHFYPMQDLECVYSPHVIVFRNNADNRYSFMSEDDKLHLNPAVSVVSMAARNHPKLSPDKSKYKDIGHRHLMKSKMRLILRTAAHNNHRRLVLGAIGCGAFGHPTQQVADCWKEILLKKEFKGWFELIHFVIRDAPKEGNLAIFAKTLDGLDMG